MSIHASPLSRTANMDTSILLSGWDVAQVVGWGAGGLGLVAFFEHFTDPTAQQMVAGAILVAAVAGLIKTWISAQKAWFRMSTYRWGQNVNEVLGPDSDDEIMTASHKPGTAKKPARKPPVKKKAGDE